MSKIIQKLDVTNLNVKEKVNLSISITRYGYYEKGEYQKYLDETILFIENEEYIDAYSLLLGLCSEFILTLKDSDYVIKLFNSYIDFIKNHYDKLSPTNVNQKKSFFEKGINSTINFIETNLREIYTETKIDTDALQKELNGLLLFLNEKGVNHDEHSKSQLFSLLLKISQAKQSHISENEETEENIPDVIEEVNSIEERNYITDTTGENQDCGKNEGSYKWVLLIKKIQAIEKLVDNKKIVEAAIVYADIQNIIANFDPNEYFPETFSPLYKVLAPIAVEIHTSIEQLSATPGWEMTKKMYETNLEIFVHDLPRMLENDQLIDSV